MAHPKILVIEDNPSEVFLLRRVLANAMKGAHFEIENWEDGEDALHFIRGHWEKRHEFQPCIILLDLHLPKFDGIEVLRAIQLDSALTQIPVMVLTNAASPKEQEEVQKMGLVCRTKPKDLAEFAKLADDLIAICNPPAVGA